MSAEEWIERKVIPVVEGESGEAPRSVKLLDAINAEPMLHQDYQHEKLLGGGKFDAKFVLSLLKEVNGKLNKSVHDKSTFADFDLVS